MAEGKRERSQVRVWVPRVILLVGVGIAGGWAWQQWDSISALLADLRAARQWFRELGVWGPLLFISLNALQIVVAPIPGYPTQAAAGYIFGLGPGALYANAGLALGCFLAAYLARVFGRPLVIRVIGEATLQRWEHMVHADSLWLWFLALVGPTGDVPYFVAGLSSVPLWQLVALSLAVRGPAVVVAAAVGAGLMTMTPTRLVAILLAAGVVMWLLYRVGPQVAARVRQRLKVSE